MDNYSTFESPDPTLSTPASRHNFQNLWQGFEQLRLSDYRENRSSVCPYNGSSMRTHMPEDYTNLNFEQLRLSGCVENRSSVSPYNHSPMRTHMPEDYTNLNFEQLRLCGCGENRSSVWPYNGSSMRTTHVPEDYTNLNHVCRALYPDNIWRYDHMNTTNTISAGNHTDYSSINNVGFGVLSPKYVDFDESNSAYYIRKMEEGHPYWTSSIFDRLFEAIPMVMTQTYGHRVFIKLIELCDQDRLQLIVEQITADHGSFLKASQDRYGSTSIKKLIKVLARSPMIRTIIGVLSSGFFTLMTNQTGFRVILTCLNTLSTRQNELLYKAATKDCLLLAVHKDGCKNLQKFIENMGTLNRHDLLDKVCESSLSLSQDPLGNYVVQHVLGLDHPLYTSMICSKLKGHFARLSLQQGASNVVEICLRSGDMECIVEDLVLERKKSFLQLAQDAYGNYVIQTALKVTMDASSTSLLYKKLTMKLQPFLNRLQMSKYGRNIVQLLEQQKEMLFGGGRSDLFRPSVV